MLVRISGRWACDMANGLIISEGVGCSGVGAAGFGVFRSARSAIHPKHFAGWIAEFPNGETPPKLQH